MYTAANELQQSCGRLRNKTVRNIGTGKLVARWQAKSKVENLADRVSALLAGCTLLWYIVDAIECVVNVIEYYQRSILPCC